MPMDPNRWTLKTQEAINEAIAGFRDSLPALHQHLEQTLVRGPACCYRPDPPVNWQF